MSFDALLKEVESLPDDERRKLMAFTVVMEDRANAEYQKERARKIDDRTPGRWLTPEQCERDLGLLGGES
jgi:hypothetical protein